MIIFLNYWFNTNHKPIILLSSTLYDLSSFTARDIVIGTYIKNQKQNFNSF